jgi:NAD(P)-dependent dehydrogenase (short-subunit alcohol dehydrogenase family)
MVKLNEIRTTNTSLKSSRSGLTAVVVGGTNGIGRGFLDALASQTDSPKIYVVGRSQQTLDTITSDLKTLSPSGVYVPILTGDLTLLANVEKATAQILAQESKLDLLFMSPGYLTFGSRDESTEGLDKITSIRHYARTLFILNLLPLLNAAPSPRVVDVLAGGLEGAIFPEDLSFRDPKNYSLVKVADATGSYVTLSLEQIQKSNPKVSFVHAFPGLVRTNLFNTEHFGAPLKFFVNWIVMPTIGRFLFASPEEAGERFLYVATAPQFGAQESEEDGSLAVGSDGKVGSGVYTLNDKQEAVHNDKVLQPLREDGSDVKIWEHTLAEFKRITGKTF